MSPIKHVKKQKLKDKCNLIDIDSLGVFILLGYFTLDIHQNFVMK